VAAGGAGCEGRVCPAGDLKLMYDSAFRFANQTLDRNDKQAL